MEVLGTVEWLAGQDGHVLGVSDLQGSYCFGRRIWRRQEGVFAGVSGSLLAGHWLYVAWLWIEIVIPCDCLVCDFALEEATAWVNHTAELRGEMKVWNLLLHAV